MVTGDNFGATATRLKVSWSYEIKLSPSAVSFEKPAASINDFFAMRAFTASLISGVMGSKTTAMITLDSCTVSIAVRNGIMWKMRRGPTGLDCHSIVVCDAICSVRLRERFTDCPVSLCATSGIACSVCDGSDGTVETQQIGYEEIGTCIAGYDRGCGSKSARHEKGEEFD